MDDSIRIHIGRRLRQRRRLMGITQQALAEACGVTFQQIQKYECGASTISVDRLWQLAEALGADPGYFYEGIVRDERKMIGATTSLAA